MAVSVQSGGQSGLLFEKCAEMASRLKADAKGDFIDALIGAQQPLFRQAYPLRQDGAVEGRPCNLPI